MPIHLGANEINTVYSGSTELTFGYLGDELIWSSLPGEIVFVDSLDAREQGTTISIDMDTLDIEVGDMILCFHCGYDWGGGHITKSVPAGYTEILRVSGGSSNMGLMIAYKFVDSLPQGNVSFSREGPGSQDLDAVSVIVLRNVDPDSPIDASVVYAESNTFPPNPGAITPTVDNSFVLTFGAVRRAAASNTNISDSTDYVVLADNDNFAYPSDFSGDIIISATQRDGVSTVNHGGYTVVNEHSEQGAFSACLSLSPYMYRNTVNEIEFLGSVPREGGNPYDTTIDLTSLPLLEGDIVLAFFSVSNNYNTTFSVPGRTELGTILEIGTQSNIRLGVYYKVQGATVDTSVTCTDTSAVSPSARTGIAQAFRGVDAVEPIYSFNISSLDSVTDASPPAIKYRRQGSVMVIGGAFTDNGEYASSPPTGYGNDIDVSWGRQSGSKASLGSLVRVYSNMCVASKTLGGIGKEYPGDFTGGTNTSGYGSAAASIVLNPSLV